MIKSPLDSFGEWTDMSVFLEIKTRTDLASLFVDVPPGFREKQPAQENQENRRTIKYADINVVNVTDNYIRIGAPPTPEALIKREKEAANGPMSIKKQQRERSTSTSGSPTKKSSKKAKKAENRSDFKPTRFGATLRDVTIKASTLCSPTFADNSGRIFMCKVNVEPFGTSGPLIQKTAHRLAVDVCKIEKLEEFAAKAFPKIICARCKQLILSEEYIMTIQCLPDDDFLATTQSADFFCRDSCGASCDPDRHKNVKREELKANPKWLPNEKKVMISYANSIIHKQSVIDGTLIIDDKANIKCAGCKCQLGKIQKNHPDIYCFNQIATTMTAGQKKIQFVDKLNMSQLSIYMAQLILNGCETQSSMKLVIRTLDKVPYMLVWLLDSYVVIANGTLEGLRSEEAEGSVLVPFPAIKLLYKVFNNQTASNDPRANGEDTSVGLIDLPLPCCEMLIELLLRSSLRSPPACRAVGQFFVGYLQIDDKI
ncbi:E3 ubiquitin-protein ligase E3D [Caenorhabditis elegans]|uniref:E3 ubiquitin-protein ligase E3D n=1 Tax=Caenorhabditis elegans TaxID=6239 RepID=Q2AAC0_CAEEL|nr:E3 ubiquitin-protein ligase E3D [Caenorhabditis elegans]CCD73861.1 E3 ubiquitin-protein ligase E3D [Caenorhabditis elegans]|eukprot:NP_497622.2 Uncharacterized protein CELE_Y71H2AM.3 [Caenorhabditis elegans]